MRCLALAVLLVSGIGCSAPSRPPTLEQPNRDIDPDGPHRDAVEAQLAPYLQAEVVSSIVVGLYDGGRLEIYGFGKGPGGKVPDGNTLYELGSVTKIYTGLLLADAIQRREVALETPVSELLPPGVTVPTFEKQPITLAHLALHTSGLPRLPPTIAMRASTADPYAKYGEEALYGDLTRAELKAPPGTRISYSNFGAGLLGFVLGRKIGGGYQRAVELRLLGPLGLKDTYFTVPAAATTRRAAGTNDDLNPVGYWNWDVLAGAGALVSTVRDQLRLVDAELDALAGGKGALRNPMRLTHENQLEGTGETQGLGWFVDSAGRYWHNGGTAGFRSFVGFDPKTKRGVVVLASGASSLVDRVASMLHDVLDGSAKPPWQVPSQAQLASYAGTYDLLGTQVEVVQRGGHLYIEGPGEPPHRMTPATSTELWIEPLQAVASFQSDEQKQIIQMTIMIAGKQAIAPRVKKS